MSYTLNLLSRRAFAGAALAGSIQLAGGARAAAAALKGTAPSVMGPFYPFERLAEDDADLTWLKGHAVRALGDVIEVSGRVLDRRGNPMAGVRLELWQANAAGRYAHPGDVSKMPLDPNFQGFAALTTGTSGEWRITTVKPAAYDSPIGKRTPHIHFTAESAAQKQKLVAQMYFSDDAAMNARDGLYKSLGGDAGTSLAKLESAGKYRWDIVLGG